MPDRDYSIDRTRRRDWPPAEGGDTTGVSVSAPNGEHAARIAKDAAAATKLANWIRGATDTCTSVKNPRHDFDRCVTDPNPRPPGAVPRTSVLFLPEPKDADAISLTDVTQGDLGDCHFLAPLAGLASTKEGRALIRDAITERKNDKGETIGYSVRLYETEWHVLGPKTFTEKRIELPAGAPYVVGHARAMGDDGHDEIWPLVMEKAYAQLRGGYDAIGRGGEVQAAMEALMGKEVRHTAADDTSDELLWSDLDAHKVVVLSSKHSIEPNPHTLEEGHAYVVVGRQDRGGGDVVYQLRNPWNDGEIKVVPYSEIGTSFDCVDVGSPGAGQ
jgi:hypothetical protein